LKKSKKIISLVLALSLAFIIFSMTTFAQGDTYHTVVKNDTLWLLAKKYATTVDELKRLNSLKSDTLSIGQKLIVVKSTNGIQEKMYIEYKIVKGDTLGKIAERFGTRIDFIKSLNGLTSDMIIEGKMLKIPAEFKEYTVVKGDTLYLIAKRFSTEVSRIKTYSGITSDNLSIGQLLKIPYQDLSVNPVTPPTSGQKPSVSYFNYTVVKGDTIWGISVKQGIPMQELLSDNKLNMESILNLGQVLKIAVHTIPIQSTPGPQFGEYLDWWTEAQYVVPINKTFKVVDFYTKKSFMIKRTIGANHADCEPLTAADAAAAKSVWGGYYSWNTRPVIVEVDGRKIAASMSYYAHGVEYVPNNDFVGHFDIHFKNSTRHVDGKIDNDHQAKIKIAAGV